MPKFLKLWRRAGEILAGGGEIYNNLTDQLNCNRITSRSQISVYAVLISVANDSQITFDDILDKFIENFRNLFRKNISSIDVRLGCEAKNTHNSTISAQEWERSAKEDLIGVNYNRFSYNNKRLKD